MMTIKEAIAIRGTEFIYVFPDGDEIRAYVKQFDPEVGFSCHSLEDETRDGFVFPAWDREEDGSVCLIGFHFNEPGLGTVEEAFGDLEIIKTGRFVAWDTGATSCAFR